MAKEPFRYADQRRHHPEGPEETAEHHDPELDDFFQVDPRKEAYYAGVAEGLDMRDAGYRIRGRYVKGPNGEQTYEVLRPGESEEQRQQGSPRAPRARAARPPGADALAMAKRLNRLARRMGGRRR